MGRLCLGKIFLDHSLAANYSLDSIPVAIQDEHEVLAVRSELQLEVLLVVVEEERLYNFVFPQLEEGFSGFSILGCWVVKVGCFYIDDKVLAISFEIDHDRLMVNRLPVPGSTDLKLLTPFLWHLLTNLELNGIEHSFIVSREGLILILSTLPCRQL